MAKLNSTDKLQTEVMGLDASGSILGNAQLPPCLVLVGGSELAGKQWLLNNGTVVLGRAQGAGICIEAVSLSKAHAEFKADNDTVSITDLGATNKTKVNGRVLSANETCVLKNNDQIQAGALIFKFLQKGILSETTEKARMQSELENARFIQSTLLPAKNHARFPTVQIGGRYRTATECGGDWWWYWSCGGKLFAMMGDATGHGAGAALITSAARAAVSTLENDPTATVERVFTTLNEALFKCAGGAVTMTAFIVEISADRKLRYINASHLPPVWLPANLSKSDWSRLQFLGGGLAPPLGLSPCGCTAGETAAAPGLRLVVLTDGLTERKRDSQVYISERAFYELLIRTHLAQPQDQSAFLDLLLAESDRMANHTVQDDDITVVALDFF